MRWVAIASALLLGGCSGVNGNYPAANMVNFATDVVNPGARDAAKAQLDDGKCQSFGFRPGTEGYANCRLELERIRGGGTPVQVQVR